MTIPILSSIIWFPILGALLLLLIRNFSIVFIKNVALILSFLSLLLCIPLFQGFNTAQWEMQFVEKLAWIPTLNINYFLGVDGISIPLIALTSFMTFLVVLSTYYSVHKKVAFYLANFFLMQGLMCGAFAAGDAVVFYSFWEAMLVPMFLIIGIWGGNNRIYATMKFFLYTFLGSVLLLVAIIYLQIKANHVQLAEPFSILTFHHLPLALADQKWLFLAFLMAFAVKIPMWPVHTWLPDAHVEAPTGGSVILAAILLKMGGYGLLRFILPITPDASAYFSPWIIALSLIAIIYIAFIAIVQKDMKKLIAYSSISHMGFVTLGLFILYPKFNSNFFQASSGDLLTTSKSLLKNINPLDLNNNLINIGMLGLEGGMIQMISHGLVAAGLFLCVGVLYDRVHSRLIKDYGGIATAMPIFSAFMFLFVLANVGFPGTSGFVGEFLIIMGTFKSSIPVAALAATILILGASYTLWMYKRVILGPVNHPAILSLPDLSKSEKWMFTLLVAGILLLGLYPAPILNFMEVSIHHLVQQMMHSKL